jgi:L-ectoine synthase
VIVKRVRDVEGGEDEVLTQNWVSRRLLLKHDSMGFSLHETTIFAGTETPMCYLNHLEAVFCVEGVGEVETEADGKRHPISAGTVYALDQHDRHILRAFTQMRMVCVFNPPLTGREVHDENGAYPLVEERGQVA